MILIDPQVNDLAAGYALIRDFVDTLESTWLPGFDRSYQRRQEEYRRAIQKHEERGLFLRTLLKTPKPPNRPPSDFKEETLDSPMCMGKWCGKCWRSTPIFGVIVRI